MPPDARQNSVTSSFDHPTRLYLIRHGEVEEKYHKVFGGSRIDMALSPLGLRQADALAAWLKEAGVEKIYASPMQRVRQTLEPTARQHSLEPEIMHGLREMDFGDWTGHRWDQVSSLFGVSAFDWLEIIENNGIPNGESSAGLASRVRECLKSIASSNPRQKTAVFCHGGIIRVMLGLLLDMPLARMAHFNVAYGSVSVVEIQPEKKHAAEIELLNFQPPLV